MVAVLEKLKGLFKLKCAKKQEPKLQQEEPEQHQEESETGQKPEEQKQ